MVLTNVSTNTSASANKGVLVTDVNYGSPAAVANLQPVDLVVEADRKRVNDIADLQSAFASAKDPILLLIKRKGASLCVVLRLKQKRIQV